MDSEHARLKQARDAMGLTLQQLASKIGYSVGTISGIENGHDKPSKRLRTRLIETLNINPSWLSSGKGVMFDGRNLPPLSPAEAEIIVEKAFAESLRECNVELTEKDFDQGWVEAPLFYKFRDTAKRYPTKVRISRLDNASALNLLKAAATKGDATVLLMPSLPASFVAAMGKGDPLRLLTPFCVFGLIRAAVRLNFGDSAAAKILSDLGQGDFLELLSEGNK